MTQRTLRHFAFCESWIGKFVSSGMSQESASMLACCSPEPAEPRRAPAQLEMLPVPAGPFDVNLWALSGEFHAVPLGTLRREDHSTRHTMGMMQAGLRGNVIMLLIRPSFCTFPESPGMCPVFNN